MKYAIIKWLPGENAKCQCKYGGVFPNCKKVIRWTTGWIIIWISYFSHFDPQIKTILATYIKINDNKHGLTNCKITTFSIFMYIYIYVFVISSRLKKLIVKTIVEEDLNAERVKMVQ